jgi:hypothetical protein
MSIEEKLPLLQRAIWQRLGERSHIRPSGLLDKLSGDTGMHPQDVRRALARLQERGWLTGVARNGEPIGAIAVLAPRDIVAEPASLTSWRNALGQAGLKESDLDCLAGVHALLSGLEEHTLSQIAAGMVKMRGALGNEKKESRFIVSARHLIGSSKLLNVFPNAILKKFFGCEPAWIEQIPYVVTAGPAEPHGVILIENPWAFERAIELGIAESHALIATFGYGLSRQGDAFGRQLASQIETRDQQLIQLRRHGAPPDLAKLFHHANLTFWGDLDPEGLRIYMRLKRRLPNLRLSSLYEPMFAQLIREGGHPYHAATGKEGQVALTAAELQAFAEVAELACACANRGLDQEALSSAAIQAYAMSSSV